MADNATARFIKQGQRSSFRATVWAAQLPVIRNERGQAIHALKKVAMVLASHADGDTGEGAYPGLERIAREAWLSTKKEAADVLHLGKELGLWTEDEEESEWGTAIWHLAIDDLDLVQRLEEDEVLNQERKRVINADKQARHRARSKGEEEPAPRNPVARVTPARPVLVVQEAPDAPAPVIRSKPNFVRGIEAARRNGMVSEADEQVIAHWHKHLPHETEEMTNAGIRAVVVHPKDFVPESEEDPWTNVYDYVTSRLDEKDTRKAHTVLMGFQARWGDLALLIAQHALETSQGRWNGNPVTIAHFGPTNDPTFAREIAALVE
jgi:hypothetical protein